MELSDKWREEVSNLRNSGVISNVDLILEGLAREGLFFDFMDDIVTQKFARPNLS